MRKKAIAALLLIYLTIVVAVDRGPLSALAVAIGLLIVSMAVYVSLRLQSSVRKHLPAIGLMAGVVGIWIAFVGLARVETDIGLALVGLAMALLVFPKSRRWIRDLMARSQSRSEASHREPNGTGGRFVLTDVRFVSLWLVFSWVLISSHHNQPKESPLYKNPARFDELAESSSGRPRIGLALSGGGYRAAIYHAGVLKGLEDRGVHVSVISTVSGGSIIGAFYALGGDPRDFLDAVKHGRFNVKRELAMLPTALQLVCPARLPVLNVKLLPFCDFSRLDVQKKVLDDVLFGGAPLLQDFRSTQPRLLINASDIYHGIMLGFSNEFLVAGNLRSNQSAALEWNKLVFFQNPEGPLISEIVAISGGFPGAFPVTELELTYRDLVPDPSSSIEAKRLAAIVERDGLDLASRKLKFLLVDGGVFDNSGFSQLMNANDWARTSTNGFSSEFERETYVRGEAPGNEWRIGGGIVVNGGQRFGRSAEMGGLGGILRSLELSGTVNQERMRVLAVAQGQGRTAYLAPELYDDIWFNPTAQPAQRSGILPEDGFHLRLEGPGQRELRRASERAWTRWRNLEEATRAACILPDRDAAMRKLAAAAKDIPTGILPYPILQASSTQGDRIVTVSDVPRWDKDFESLRNWIDGGNCDDRDFESLFSTAYIGNCAALDFHLSIAQDIQLAYQIFENSPTLKDQYSDEEADALFRLGQYSVVLNWAKVAHAIGRADTVRGDSTFECPNA